jgi:hypothetical protein
MAGRIQLVRLDRKVPWRGQIDRPDGKARWKDQMERPDRKSKTIRPARIFEL